MEEQLIERTVSLSDLYVRRLSQMSSQKEIEDELKKYAKYHSLDYEMTLYFFIKKLIKLELFFKMNKEVAEELLFSACFWASKQESKKKIRPNSMKKMPKDKSKNYFTQLQKEFIKALIKHYSDNEFMLNIELNRFLIFFFELTCIRRDRRKKNDI